MTNHSARASALGYSYQPRYALLLLLRGGSNVSLYIERFDDIEILNETGQNLVQLKNRKAGNLSDSGSDLWKTLKIWLDLYREGKIDLDNVELTIITTASAKQNSAASMLGINKRNPVIAAQILERIASQSKNVKQKKYYSAFLRLQPHERTKLLERVTILDSSPNVVKIADEIRRELRRTTRKEYLNAFMERLEGWWTDHVIRHLSGESDEPISGATLDAKIGDLREQFFADNLPIDYRNLSLTKRDKKSAKEKIFVKQLELLMLKEPRILSAIYDYYKAYNQRSRWIKDDLIYFDELENYRNRLIDEWKRRFDRMNDILSTSPDQRSKIEEGKKIYDWVEFETDFCIRPRCTEPYVVRGTYHMLANELDVGWRSDFFQELKHLLIEMK